MQEVIQQVHSALKIVDSAVEGFNRAWALISSPVLSVEDLNFFARNCGWDPPDLHCTSALFSVLGNACPGAGEWGGDRSGFIIVRTQNTELILVLLFSYCVIFHTNSCRATVAPPCIYYKGSSQVPFVVLVWLWRMFRSVTISRDKRNLPAQTLWQQNLGFGMRQEKWQSEHQLWGKDPENA